MISGSSISFLASFGPVHEAVTRADKALKNGKNVCFYCLRNDVFNFLNVINSSQVRVLDLSVFESTAPPNPLRPITIYKWFRKFVKPVKSYWKEHRNNEVFIAATCIDLRAIISAVELSKSNKIYYNPQYELRWMDGNLLSFQTTKLRRKFKSTILRLILDCEVCYFRDWSPICGLTDDFCRARFEVLSTYTYSADPAGPLMRSLSRHSAANVLFLFCNLLEYYGETNENVIRETTTLWEKLARDLISFENEGQAVAVKIHPSTTKVPECLARFQRLDSSIPIEFFQFPKLNTVILDASSSTAYLQTIPGVRLLSYTQNYPDSAFWKDEMMRLSGNLSAYQIN